MISIEFSSRKKKFHGSIRAFNIKNVKYGKRFKNIFDTTKTEKRWGMINFLYPVISWDCSEYFEKRNIRDDLQIFEIITIIQKIYFYKRNSRLLRLFWIFAFLTNIRNNRFFSKIDHESKRYGRFGKVR